jgi:uncharacterized protein YbjT (DUF2867 family)
MKTKIIAVVGSTGAQGGGLVRAILGDPARTFSVRAITRKPDGEKAKKLASLGAEVVAADLDDKASLARAFAGVHGAYCVTNYWEHMNPEKEIAQAKNLADAAKEARVSHAIWSTLEDTRLRVPLSDTRMPTLMEKYKVPHFDTKGSVDPYFLERVPATLLLTSFYWDNFIYFGLGPKPIEGGKLGLVLPIGDAKLPSIAAEDIGRCALGVFKRGQEFVGKRIGICGEQLSGIEMASAMSRALAREVVYQPVPPNVYRGFGFPGAEDLGNMFQYNVEFEAEFRGARDVDFSRSLAPGLLTFAAWLERYAARIPIG